MVVMGVTHAIRFNVEGCCWSSDDGLRQGSLRGGRRRRRRVGFVQSKVCACMLECWSDANPWRNKAQGGSDLDA